MGSPHSSGTRKRTVRLFGDYKVTINPHLKMDSHPLPRAEELFSKLAGGEKFTKLDISHAYQQMALEESSKELVTTLYKHTSRIISLHTVTFWGSFCTCYIPANNG